MAVRSYNSPSAALTGWNNNSRVIGQMMSSQDTFLNRLADRSSLTCCLFLAGDVLIAALEVAASGLGKASVMKAEATFDGMAPSMSSWLARAASDRSVGVLVAITSTSSSSSVSSSESMQNTSGSVVRGTPV